MDGYNPIDLMGSQGAFAPQIAGAVNQLWQVNQHNAAMGGASGAGGPPAQTVVQGLTPSDPRWFNNPQNRANYLTQGNLQNVRNMQHNLQSSSLLGSIFGSLGHAIGGGAGGSGFNTNFGMGVQGYGGGLAGAGGAAGGFGPNSLGGALSGYRAGSNYG